MGDFETLSEHASFGGVQGFYQHDSTTIGLPMRFAVYRPPQAAFGRVPLLMYLAGLTCTEETFAVKAGAQQRAAQHGLMLVMPDTSPRPGTEVSPGRVLRQAIARGLRFPNDRHRARRLLAALMPRSSNDDVDDLAAFAQGVADSTRQGGASGQPPLRHVPTSAQGEALTALGLFRQAKR